MDADRQIEMGGEERREGGDIYIPMYKNMLIEHEKWLAQFWKPRNPTVRHQQNKEAGWPALLLPV